MKSMAAGELDSGQPRVILIEPDADGREVLARRLRAQGFSADAVGDGAAGAALALADPPAAIVCDLWMPGVSGVQICRLLRAEPATADVPVILRAERDDARSRFWAAHAGAAGLVAKGRVGELVRMLAAVAKRDPADDTFFFQLSSGSRDVVERIAEHLDRALCESVIASEVRALASAASFERLFDVLSQLLCQLVSYRWLAIATGDGERLAIHANPRCASASEDEARKALGGVLSADALRIEDDDAQSSGDGPVVVVDMTLGHGVIGRLAVGLEKDDADARGVFELVARELVGPLRIALLVEQSEHRATSDSLTNLMNRRAFDAALSREMVRADRTRQPLSVLVVDVDHFKMVNDRRGHAAGDAVLAMLGRVLPEHAREYDLVARWGGEEFVVALPGADVAAARSVAERLRLAVDHAVVRDSDGEPLSVTISVGAAERAFGEGAAALFERADRAMYAAKKGGRNRVCVAGEDVDAPPVALAS